MPKLSRKRFPTFASQSTRARKGHFLSAAVSENRMNTAEPQSMSVLIVDGHPIMRIGIATILSNHRIVVLAQVGTGAEAVSAHRKFHPDVTLMDLRLPDMSGLEAMRRVRTSAPDAKFVILTTCEGDEDIRQALEAGADGYLSKGMSHDVLLRALHEVYRGRQFLPNAVAQTLRSQMHSTRLSSREREVLQLLFEGKSNRQISEDLQITEATVKSHVSVILMRLNVEDRTQAVVQSLRRGLVHF
jgi:DNA-binding NarL/FixJ family response regulator